MKKIIYLLLCLSIIFGACKKEDDTGNSGNPGNTATSIIGTWDWDLVIEEWSWTIENGGMIIYDSSWSWIADPDTSEDWTPGYWEFTNNGLFSLIDFTGTHNSGQYVVSGNQITLSWNSSEPNWPGTIITLDENKLILSFVTDTSFSSNQGTQTQIRTWIFEYSRIGMSEFNVLSRLGKPNNSWFIKPNSNNFYKLAQAN